MNKRLTIPSSQSLIFEVKSTGSDLAFIRVLRLRTSSEDFGLLRKTSSGIFGNDCAVIKNPSTPKIKISRLDLRKSWQIYCKPFYYMASSSSEQDEPNCALWLATWAGKMEPSCPLRTTRYILQAKFPQKPYNKSFIDQVRLVKMAGYWPCSFFASLWTSTSSWSMQKMNLANIQPSWSHTWSQ